MNALYTRALAAYEQKDYESAVPLLREAATVTDNPEQRERMLIRCAIALDGLARYAESLETIKEVLEFSPDSAAAWNNLGIVCQHIGKLDEARAAFERAYKLNPEQADPLVNLGAVCLRQSDPGNALQYLQLALELLPGHPAVHANLALTYAIFGRLEEAEDCLRLAVLYGFEEAPLIEEKISAMKNVRESILTQARLRDQAAETGSGAADGSERPDAADDRAGTADRGAVSDDPDDSGEIEDEASASAGEMDLLVLLENEMYSLAERCFAEQPPTTESERVRLTARMSALRPQIRLLRRALGMDEVTDSDTVRGINYMHDDSMYNDTASRG